MEKQIIDISKGRRLELALDVKGISKSELARMMGKKRQLVNEWCKNSNFSLTMLEKILKAIDMTMADFWNLKESRNDSAN